MQKNRHRKSHAWAPLTELVDEQEIQLSPWLSSYIYYVLPDLFPQFSMFRLLTVDASEAWPE
jgi:hypothetical protein